MSDDVNIWLFIALEQLVSLRNGCFGHVFLTVPSNILHYGVFNFDLQQDFFWYYFEALFLVTSRLCSFGASSDLNNVLAIFTVCTWSVASTPPIFFIISDHHSYWKQKQTKGHREYLEWYLLSVHSVLFKGQTGSLDSHFDMATSRCFDFGNWISLRRKKFNFIIWPLPAESIFLLTLWWRRGGKRGRWRESFAL